MESAIQTLIEDSFVHLSLSMQARVQWTCCPMYGGLVVINSPVVLSSTPNNCSQMAGEKQVMCISTHSGRGHYCITQTSKQPTMTIHAMWLQASTWTYRQRQGVSSTPCHSLRSEEIQMTAIMQQHPGKCLVSC